MKYLSVFVIITLHLVSHNDARRPFKPNRDSLPFVVYYTSRYRGMCIGSLVSRRVVLTAAVCVINPSSPVPDRRPINVITGAAYRHPRSGIKVQVTRILIPKLPDITSHKGFLLQKSSALLLLKRSVPDSLPEVPLRAIEADLTGDIELELQEECATMGWHFFFKGDIIYPINKFLLQRNIRVQYLNVVKKQMWCGTLTLKLQKALESLGFFAYFDEGASLCVKDPDRAAQPCHGMYGAPLVCRGKIVALLTAPDAQWTNCTGKSAIFHKLKSKTQSDFFECVSSLFEPDLALDMAKLKRTLLGLDEDKFDYLHHIYDRIAPGSDSSSD